MEWSTEGVVSHTTAEVRDAGSDEIVFYRDTDGEWTPEKGEVSYFALKQPMIAHSSGWVDLSTRVGDRTVSSCLYVCPPRNNADCLQLVYLDFKPKIAGQSNKTVDYTVRLCE